MTTEQGSTSSLPSVTVQEAAAALEDGSGTRLIDVRETNEFVELRVDGAALVQLGTLEARFTELPQDSPLLMMCRSGGRSGRATAFLMQQGFADVRNVDGGMIAWKDAGLPTRNGVLSDGEGDL
jgi:rhodanese-related sulfurtransferase